MAPWSRRAAALEATQRVEAGRTIGLEAVQPARAITNFRFVLTLRMLTGTSVR
jgi:hypothetical protein